jgi:hypothetical protein
MAGDDDEPAAETLKDLPELEPTDSMRSRIFAGAWLALALGPAPMAAQHRHEMPTRDDTAGSMNTMMQGPLGISHVRMGSGTSWLPDRSTMYANHKMWGAWMAMLHGVAFFQYDDQGGPRGADQLGVVDWEMVMAMRRVKGGLLHLHGMLSLEPWTLGERGYPLLLQTGEAADGLPLHDRQHPHDFFMELAAMYERAFTPRTAGFVYAAAVGEPALGPVAYMHRPSAQSDPLAPIGHHWQDATHISFGVITAGTYTRRVRLEASVFNGREPDENRWNFDYSGRGLDSYAGRLTVNPDSAWSFAAWTGWLKSPEAIHPEESVTRFGFSALNSRAGIRGGEWATLAMYSANSAHGTFQPGVLLESNLEIGQRQAVFMRAEVVRKTAEELVLPAVPDDELFTVGSLVAGYVHELVGIPGGTIGAGLRGSINFVNEELSTFYGSRVPAGLAVYVRVRPKRM